MPSPISFRSSCEIAIHVPDLAQAEEFYGGVLGFRLVSKSGELLEFDTGALRLYVNHDTETTPAFIPSLRVSDYSAAKTHLQAAGCDVVHESPDAGGFYFRDPFGLVIDVIERP